MLKGPLTPGRKKAEVFNDFGHRPMPHSVVVYAAWTMWRSKQVLPMHGEWDVQVSVPTTLLSGNPTRK